MGECRDAVLQNTVLRKIPLRRDFSFLEFVVVWYTGLELRFARGATALTLEQCFGARIRFPHGAQDTKICPAADFVLCARA